MKQLTLMDPPTMTSVVYFATDLVNIKIGRTTSKKRRGGELRVHMLHSIPGSEFEEKRQHRMWGQYRIGSTEWFRPGDKLLIWLAGHISLDQVRELAALQQLILNVRRKTA